MEAEKSLPWVLASEVTRTAPQGEDLDCAVHAINNSLQLSEEDGITNGTSLSQWFVHGVGLVVIWLSALRSIFRFFASDFSPC